MPSGSSLGWVSLQITHTFSRFELPSALRGVMCLKHGLHRRTTNLQEKTAMNEVRVSDILQSLRDASATL